jgi:hypothetical protein
VGLVVELALSEMFGTVAEEKEVMKITAKLAEAKGTKSYDSLQILAKYETPLDFPCFGSGFSWVCMSRSILGIRIRFWFGKNYHKKREEILCFKVRYWIFSLEGLRLLRYLESPSWRPKNKNIEIFHF